MSPILASLWQELYHALTANIPLDRLEEICKAERDGTVEDQWISVDDQLPEAEKRVLVCAETRCADGKRYQHITTAMHENGTIWREESDWKFNDFDGLEAYDEEQDDWKIPEGWWEYTIYNDEEGNYMIDDFVTHWRPLPAPPQKGA